MKTLRMGETHGQRQDSLATSIQERLSTVSTELIRQELQRRQRELDKLLKRRERLAHELADLDASLQDLRLAVGVVGREKTADHQDAMQTGRGRANPARLVLPPVKNSLSLADALVSEFEPGEHLTAAELAKRVKKSGYVSAAKNFNAQVSHALRKDKRLVRVGVGEYSLAEAIGCEEAAASQVSIRSEVKEGLAAGRDASKISSEISGSDLQYPA